MASDIENGLGLTAAAESFVRRMLRLGGGPSAGFRLQVSPGGCSGMASSFSIESAPEAGDRVLQIRGLSFFIPPASYRLLEGVTIDFVETPWESKLEFLDPRAASCGCSTAEPESPAAGSALPSAGR